MTTTNTVLAITAALLLVGVLASRVSTRLGVPALLLFLAIGMLAGSDGIGGIDFEDYELAQSTGIVALAFILFSGGLGTSWPSIRPVVREGISLATVGVLITAVVSGLLAAAVLGWSVKDGLLLGAIMSSTDAAAVFSVLRSRNASLRARTTSLLELESGSNDPMAVFLTIGILELVVEPETSPLTLVPLFVAQMAVGALVGVLLARLAVAALNRLRLDAAGLYPVATTAIVLGVYATAALLGGSGFLAVYLAGLVMAQQDFVHKRSLVRFHDGVAWLCQIGMFLVLGLLVFPSDLPPLAAEGLLISAGLIFVARPLSVLVALAASGMPWRDRAMVAWVGLRGAAPIILATFPFAKGVALGPEIFDMVFFVVLTSVLIQGTSIPFVARRLGVATPLPVARPYPLEPGEPTPDGTRLHEATISDDAAVVGRPLVSLGLPPGTLIVLIDRGERFVVPQGTSTLRAGDKVLFLADAEHEGRARDILRAKRPR